MVDEQSPPSRGQGLKSRAQACVHGVKRWREKTLNLNERKGLLILRLVRNKGGVIERYICRRAGVRESEGDCAY